jgi:hypothetical protein
MSHPDRRVAAIPLNVAARLMLELRERARRAVLEPADLDDPLAAVIRRIEAAPGSRQSVAAFSVMTDIVRNMARPATAPEALEDIADELVGLIALFSERYHNGYLHDPRLARFRHVKQPRSA